MNWILTKLQRLICKHDWRWLRNIHGDEINHYNGHRSHWRCYRCGKTVSRPEYKNLHR